VLGGDMPITALKKKARECKPLARRPQPGRTQAL
jgi:hypothetical protein